MINSFWIEFPPVFSRFLPKSCPVHNVRHVLYQFPCPPSCITLYRCVIAVEVAVAVVNANEWGFGGRCFVLSLLPVCCLSSHRCCLLVLLPCSSCYLIYLFYLFIFCRCFVFAVADAVVAVADAVMIVILFSHLTRFPGYYIPRCPCTFSLIPYFLLHAIYFPCPVVP